MQRILLFLLLVMPLQQAMAQYGASAEAVGENIYQVPLSGCNAAFYVGEDGVYVVDAGMTPDEGRQLIEAVRSVTDKPLLYLILTHYHFDHVGGVQVFPDETKIVAHQNFSTAVKKDGGKLLKGFIEEMEAQYVVYEAQISEHAKILESAGKYSTADSLRQKLLIYRSFIDSSRAVKSVKPDLVFEKSLILKSGKEKLELRYPGNAHSGCDLIVIFPGGEVVHIGDLNFGRSFPYLDRSSGGSIYGWIKALDDISTMKQVTTVLSGHDAPGNLGTLQEMKTLLNDMLDAVNSAVFNKLSLEETLRTVTMEKYDAYPGRDLLEKDIRAIYEELTGK
jgi:cyclase